MLDLDALRALVAAHGPVARVVVMTVHGSAPREEGAAMLVHGTGQEGTIGGGALEWQAAATARALLARPGPARIDRLALGPALGQCCGGAVTLLTEVWDEARLASLRVAGGLTARPLDGSEMPLAVARLLDRARAQGATVPLQQSGGWLVEPLLRPRRTLWIWGAGHVGRALVAVLAPLPDLAIRWIDIAPDRFPATIPPGVEVVAAADPAGVVAEAPAGAEHLILTYSHALDLELCHRLLGHGFGACGLIGSASKRARFAARLAALGHGADAMGRIDCPIGDPGLGKHPQAIAIGVAAAVLNRRTAAAERARA
ncbi:MAG: xanthine dehydrogenase accessory protein XdhC [Gemmobacter sp.]